MAKKKRINPLEAPVDIAGGFRQAASGAAILAAAIDRLLPALIRIEAGHGDPRELAREALKAYEQHRGQYLDRRAIMETYALEQKQLAAEQLAFKRNAGIATNG